MHFLFGLVFFAEVIKTGTDKLVTLATCGMSCFGNQTMLKIQLKVILHICKTCSTKITFFVRHQDVKAGT